MKKKMLMLVLLMMVCFTALFSLKLNEFPGENITISYNGSDYLFKKMLVEDLFDCYFYLGTEFEKTNNNVVNMFGFANPVRSPELEKAIGTRSVAYNYIHLKSGMEGSIIIAYAQDEARYVIMVFLPKGTKI